MTKKKCVLTKYLTPAPIHVPTAPTTIPFLMPLVSITQLEGKLMKMYVMMYDMGISATVESDWSYALAMGTEMGVTTTQHMPLTKDRTKKIVTIANLFPYCRYSSSVYDL